VQYYDYEMSDTDDRRTARREQQTGCWSMRRKLPHHQLGGVWVPGWAMIRHAHIVHDCSFMGFCTSVGESTGGAHVVKHDGDPFLQVLLSRFALLHGPFPE
jgi:hypothetical protein